MLATGVPGYHLPRQLIEAEVAVSGFSATMNRADALAIVSPEYNHGYSGLLKQHRGWRLPRDQIEQQRSSGRRHGSSLRDSG